jgi:site-specific DNA-methyltransferase (adenine-specific)
METNKIQELWFGDCLELMKNIPDKSIDMILCDLPYGTTACKWDIVIPFDKLWEQYNRIIKPKKCIALFGSEPFSSSLRYSNLENYKYDWYWNKGKAGNFVQAKRMPLKLIECISIFSTGGKMPEYFPIEIDRIKPITRGVPSESGQIKNLNAAIPSRNKYAETYFTKKPTTLVNFGCVRKTIHPTQKPVALMEYLIKTYTNEGETVLDNCMGSGSTGVACVNTNRKFIGIEMDENYFNIACDRIEEAINEKKQLLF